MPTYKVWVEVEQDPQRGYIIIPDADNEQEARELAEAAFDEDSTNFKWDELDMTKTDIATAVAVEEIK